MSLKTQTEDLLKKVQDAQRRMWELCSESIKTVAGAPMDKKWEASIVATEKVLNSSLQAQNELTALVVERLNKLEHLPDSAADSTRSIQEMVERLTSTQQQIIGTWFETLRKMDPMATKAGSSPLAQPVRRLHEQAIKALDTQLELLRAWTGQPSKLTTKKTSKKTPRAKTTARKKTTSKKRTTKKTSARTSSTE